MKQNVVDFADGIWVVKEDFEISIFFGKHLQC